MRRQASQSLQASGASVLVQGEEASIPVWGSSGEHGEHTLTERISLKI